MNITASHLKSAVLSYSRFERKWIVATEVEYSNAGGIADVLIDTGDEIIEVETKVDKSDLLDHEPKKQKHDYIKTGRYLEDLPNKFYLCVPHNLQKLAEDLIDEINPNYGLMIFDTRSKKIHARSISVVRNPKKLHESYNPKIKELLIFRLCSEVVNFYEKKANETFSRNTRGNSTPGRSRNVNRRIREVDIQNIGDDIDEELDEKDTKFY